MVVSYHWTDFIRASEGRVGASQGILGVAAGE